MYSRSSLLIFLLSLTAQKSFASPLLPRLLQFESNTAPTPVPNDFVTSTLLNPALFTRVAYCPGNVVTKWNCGVPCAAVRGVQVLKVGGSKFRIYLFCFKVSFEIPEDDNAVPNCKDSSRLELVCGRSNPISLVFVAYVESMNTVVVAHRGTDPDHIKSVLDDAKALLVPLDTSTFFTKVKGSKYYFSISCRFVSHIFVFHQRTFVSMMDFKKHSKQLLTMS